MSPLTLRLHGPAATVRCGAALAACLRGGMVVTLQGDLGAGKTTLVRGLLRALGIEGAVRSPTYTLVEHYPLSSLYFYHFDFYRFTSPDEWDYAGMAEYFGDDTVCIVEWPERVGDRLPAPDLALSLAYTNDTEERELVASAHTALGAQCLKALAAQSTTRS